MKSHYLCILVFLNSSKIKSFSYIQPVTMFLTCFFMIPIVFLLIIFVLTFLIIFLVQVIIFFICFYLVLNLTTKVRTFTYDWASSTGKTSSNVCRTILLRFVWLQRTFRGLRTLDRFATGLETSYSSFFSTQTQAFAYELGLGALDFAWPWPRAGVAFLSWVQREKRERVVRGRERERW